MADKKDHDLEVLHHEPWKGFRLAFWIVFVISIIYLIFIFIEGFGNTH